MSAILLALTLAASPATKLGVYVMGDDAVSKTLLVAPVCPPLAVFAVTTSNIPTAQVAAFRSACPGSRVVAQVGGAGMSVDAATATAFWPLWSTQLGTLGVTNYDAVEGPSAPSSTDDTSLAAFWSAFADLVRQQPTVKIPVVGSLATGTSTSTMCAIANAVAAQVPSWAWSFHAFSTALTQDPTTESSTTLGYRAIRVGCPSLAGVPIYLTQAGPASGRAWQTTDLAWLAWLDARLAEDGDVFAAALFEAGGTDRSLEPIASQLVAYLQNPSTPDGGTPDGGTGAGQGGIAGGGSFLPGGAPVKYPSSGCASAGAGAGLALLALVAPLVLRRRKRDRGGKQ